MVERLNIKYYSTDIDAVLDKKLDNLLAQIGFTRWASGHNMVNERDLCFEQDVEAVSKDVNIGKVPPDFFCELPLDTPIIVRKVDDRYGYVLLTNDE